MRSLPWTSTSTSNAPSPKGTKRKRNVSPVATSPRTEPLDPIDSSSEDFDNTVQDKESQLEDAMIPGYANDDAYIMVEHDLLEQAKSVTRHIHLEAYKRQISAPVAEEEIVRPTVANRRKDTNVSASEWEEEEKGDINENGLQSSTLDELLSEKPAARVAPATPIKRRTITVSSKDNAEKRREKNSTFGLTATTKPTSEITGMGQDIRIPVKDVVEVQEDEDEDDEEDLDRRRPPRKVLNLAPLSYLIDLKDYTTTKRRSLKATSSNSSKRQVFVEEAICLESRARLAIWRF